MGQSASTAVSRCSNLSNNSNSQDLIDKAVYKTSSSGENSDNNNTIVGKSEEMTFSPLSLHDVL